MIEKVLRHLRNWFVVDKTQGTFDIKNGSLTLPLLEGQYFRIIGSLLNDGVYQYPAALINETFSGEVWALAIPNAVLELITEIDEWEKKNGAVTPYSSESFGGYSYTKAQKDGKPITWEDAFNSRLKFWRKI